MRFIGNKEKLAPIIYDFLQKLGLVKAENQSFFDVFSGSVSVGKFFRHKGFKVYGSDMLYFSYCLQKAYLEYGIPTFEKLLPLIEKQSLQSRTFFNTPYENVLNFLNSLRGVQGFIGTHYAPNPTNARMYFTQENAQKIDAMRLQIEQWKNEHHINESEYFILLATLLESVSLFANVAGVYAAFCKSWDKRALKPFMLKAIEFSQGISGECFCGDSVKILQGFKKSIDILYLDPPYNQRQYAPNYHLLETLARYDNPSIKGVAGMREWGKQKSLFCNAKTALIQLENIAKLPCYKNLVLSYNSDGIMQKDSIFKLLESFGKVSFCEIPYRRFKSNAKVQKNGVFEYLWVLEKST
ncbi:DNA adenine methylase [Campylobacter felis]|uniref:site-specific DNA-methyltransferase (adenine-specific) n=1 Tax=Campylobacter felis TaxID=2974565 RepID=A0ABT7I440_9BACT|nr:DNA adenine methylase [Campylobacter felis]MDL0108266.1 DNA adenine methylase [Campylobacter felis]MDL0146806.1 DNA adenine methylase [Campylobacter felis]